MSRGYSLDLRTRLVECVEAGASRHEAAERFEVSVSSAVRWMQRFVRFGSVAAKPSAAARRRWKRMRLGFSNWLPSIRI
jgi:transposase